MSLDTTVDTTVDGDVEFAFEVTNNGPDAVELTFRSGKRADVAVTDTETGDEVWRWSQNRMFTQAISTIKLESGDTFDRTFTWSDPPTGGYEAEAALAANRSATASTSFSV
ncbi:MAG: hypothetical protein J07HX64_02723 [halophilic archaeon J07HX64]|jgi:hypothetical protein|nr:MAG: hypothetical protein J07HX64_02723 [halophilic archaeon J07HX64]